MNVTVSLPDELVRRARRTAADSGVSLSKFVATVLEREVNGGLTYDEARKRDLERIARGPLYEVGEITWTREDLHDRQL